MSAQLGRDMLVKVQQNGEYKTIAGLRTKSLRFNTKPVDITHSESAQQWREVLPGAGVKTADIRGAGLCTDGVSDALARALFFDQRAENFQFILPGFGTLEGPFVISSLSYAGTYQGEVTYELSLTSAGAISFEALS